MIRRVIAWLTGGRVPTDVLDQRCCYGHDEYGSCPRCGQNTIGTQNDWTEDGVIPVLCCCNCGWEEDIAW